MPAAAVIPAPVAYIKAVAVKKLVVGYQCVSGPVCLAAALARHCWAPKYRLAAFNRAGSVLRRGLVATGDVTLNKLECSKQALYACIHIHGIGEYVPGSIWLVLRVEGKLLPRMFSLVKNES